MDPGSVQRFMSLAGAPLAGPRGAGERRSDVADRADAAKNGASPPQLRVDPSDTGDRIELVRRLITEATRRLLQKGRELTFEFDEEARRMVVKLVDTRTREVLRQIPTEEALAIARALEDNATVGALLRADA